MHLKISKQQLTEAHDEVDKVLGSLDLHSKFVKAVEPESATISKVAMFTLAFSLVAVTVAIAAAVIR